MSEGTSHVLVVVSQVPCPLHQLNKEHPALAVTGYVTPASQMNRTRNAVYMSNVQWQPRSCAQDSGVLQWLFYYGKYIPPRRLGVFIFYRRQHREAIEKTRS